MQADSLDRDEQWQNPYAKTPAQDEQGQEVEAGFHELRPLSLHAHSILEALESGSEAQIHRDPSQQPGQCLN